MWIEKLEIDWLLLGSLLLVMISVMGLTYVIVWR